jgi:RNA polymerase sigma-70 factor (ECF subfamily)
MSEGARPRAMEERDDATGEASDEALLEAARAGEPRAFDVLASRHRAPLRALCYRMLGAPADAEDAVQEALLRAWRGLDTWAGRASPRSWLFAIAAKSCLDVADARRRAPHPDSEAIEAAWRAEDPLRPIQDAILIRPCPSGWFVGEAAGPEATVDARESVALAFVAALQLLPPRQRVVLILRDVLGWSTSETAAALEVAPGAAESLLFRARATLEREAPRWRARPRPPSAAAEEALFRRYLAAWEAVDADAMVAVLREDGAISMPVFGEAPTMCQVFGTWFRGREGVRDFMIAGPFQGLTPDRIRGVVTSANGSPAAVAYIAHDGEWAAFGLMVVDVAADGVAESTMYLEPSLLRFFGIAETLPAGRGD